MHISMDIKVFSLSANQKFRLNGSGYQNKIDSRGSLKPRWLRRASAPGVQTQCGSSEPGKRTRPVSGTIRALPLPAAHHNPVELDRREEPGGPEPPGQGAGPGRKGAEPFPSSEKDPRIGLSYAAARRDSELPPLLREWWRFDHVTVWGRNWAGCGKRRG